MHDNSAPACLLDPAGRSATALASWLAAQPAGFYVIYQKLIAAYANPNRRAGEQAMTRLITSIRRGVPAGLDEIAQLGRTL